MTPPPPPAEPIRRIGPLDGSVYVDRAGRTDRVARRRRRDKDDPEERRKHPHDEPEDAPTGLRRTHAPIADTGAYDDHGRHPDQPEPPDTPHIDATA